MLGSSSPILKRKINDNDSINQLLNSDPQRLRLLEARFKAQDASQAMDASQVIHTEESNIFQDFQESRSSTPAGIDHTKASNLVLLACDSMMAVDSMPSTPSKKAFNGNMSLGFMETSQDEFKSPLVCDTTPKSSFSRNDFNVFNSLL